MYIVDVLCILITTGDDLLSLMDALWSHKLLPINTITYRNHTHNADYIFSQNSFPINTITYRRSNGDITTPHKLCQAIPNQ